MSVLLASVAGALGAVARYLVSGWAQRSVASAFPIGTLIVNVVGSFALGVVVGAGPTDTVIAVAVVGFLGGFTTFSTWMAETLRLWPVSGRAIASLAISLGGGLLAAVLGFTLAA